VNLGRTIASIRKRKGIQQQELAERIGVSPPYLSQIEHERREPTLGVLRAISEHLQVPLPFLFFLALDEEDVPASKREAFALLAPSVRSFISAILGDETVLEP
jgi:XRE family transcriptional regulator, regulator of sulfur utilization